MPLTLVELIRRYVFRYILLPAVVVTLLGAAFAVGFALWQQGRAEKQLLAANANVFEQLVLGGDSVGLSRQLSAVASSRQWTQAYVLDAGGRVIAAYPSEELIGTIAGPRLCAQGRGLGAGVQGAIGRMCWDSDPWKAAIPTVLAFLGVLAVIVWSQASLGIFLGRTISTHTKSLERLSKLFVRTKPLDPEDLADMPHETMEATQLLQAIRKFIVFQRQLRSAEIETEKQKALTVIATQVAHDIRSPLAALDTVLQDVAHLPEDKRLMVRGAAGRIRDIANNLLKSHREFGAGTGAPTPGSEPGAVELLSSLIGPLITEKRLQFRSKIGVEIDARLDAASYGLFAKVRSADFKRVLSNLINNAVEAVGEKGAVSVSLSSSAGQASIAVQDSGLGIPPEILARLGQRGATFGKEGGAGLGLFHARASVESWGGRFDLESRVGHGTKVSIELPLESSPAWFVARLALPPGSTVVIVDDDASIHQVWQGRFDAVGAGESGIDTLHFSTPDELRSWSRAGARKAGATLCLLDYEFAGRPETGLSLARELDLGESAVLVTSRFEEPEIFAECLRLKVRIIPKDMAGIVPIEIAAVRGDWDAVLIDDDPLVRRTWQIAASRHGKKIRVFATGDEFLAREGEFSLETRVYVDSLLAGGQRGEELAERLFALGFKDLFLATGREAGSFAGLPHIRGVVGKDPPWRSL